MVFPLWKWPYTFIHLYMLMQNISQKEIILEEKIQKLVADIVEHSDIDDDLPVRVMKQLLENEEIKAIQDYANTVSISRLGLNDHGPVHMRTVCRNALKMLRILHEIPTKPAEGDIHKYSANSIEKVHITQGIEHPIKIEVLMKSEVGLFQVEGVLMPKIQSSPSKHLMELYACVEEQEAKRYL